MSAAWSEKRKYPRSVFTTTIQYSVDSSSQEGPSKSVTVNISKSGVCLYTFNKHEKGDSLKIHNGVPYNLNSAATIRWVKKVNEQLFKIGCEFEAIIEF